MLRIERDNRGIVTLTLDRPEARNALSAELVARLTEALASLAGDATVRAVLLTGSGAVFCAGADIGEMRASGAASTDQNEADSRRFALMLESLEKLPQPTVAVVNGAAYGGAVGLIAACDIAAGGIERAARAFRSPARAGPGDDLALRDPRHRAARVPSMVPDRRGHGRIDRDADRTRA